MSNVNQAIIAWNKVKEHCNNDDVEEMLRALGEYFEQDALNETHPVVVSILKDLSETMRRAALDYYVSTK